MENRENFLDLNTTDIEQVSGGVNKLSLEAIVFIPGIVYENNTCYAGVVGVYNGPAGQCQPPSN